MMKRLLTVITVLACMAGAAQAQNKIATIHLRRVFDSYWKTKAASADLRGRTDEYDQDLRRLVGQYQKANETYRQLVAKYNDAATTPEEKKKVENEAQAKLAELREMDTEVNQFVQHSRTLLNEKQQRLRASILVEIGAIVSAKARAANYDLVVDISGDTANNVPTVIFSSGKADLTESVIEELNAKAPADAAKVEPPPAGATAPAPKEEKKAEEKKADDKAKDAKATPKK